MTEALILITAVLIAFAIVTLMARANAADARDAALRKWLAETAGQMQRFSTAIATFGVAVSAAAVNLAAFGRAINAGAEFEAKHAQIEAAFGAASDEMTAWLTARREQETR